MPELPEVETVRNVLDPQLRGRRVAEIAAMRPEIVIRPEFSEFRREVVSSVIRGMGRRGKFLLVHLDSGATVILHLRMTGQLLCVPADFPVKPHTHVIFELDGGTELRFTDARRFGRFWLVRAGEEDTFSGIGKLGPEPFDETFSPEYLEQKLGKSTAPVKQKLLDQSVVAGIGNIYGDEALFDAKIRPQTPARGITKKGWKEIAAAVRGVLARAIAGNAVTPSEYLADGGNDYRHNDFYVYGRGGEPCRVCGTAIERVKISGRTSCYCRKCQK